MIWILIQYIKNPTQKTAYKGGVEKHPECWGRIQLEEYSKEFCGKGLAPTVLEEEGQFSNCNLQERNLFAEHDQSMEATFIAIGHHPNLLVFIDNCFVEAITIFLTSRNLCRGNACEDDTSGHVLQCSIMVKKYSIFLRGKISHK